MLEKGFGFEEKRVKDVLIRLKKDILITLINV